ncbi:sugar transferase [Saccharopolyspora shandongensis]|uniref:sugar transferase n=1 Tax=Saccharopolyspora shandongensis TaxID=418495 RepID=UPI0034060218
MRRAVDVVVVLLSAILSIPLCLIIGLLVLLTMGRPVLFRQERAGKDGATFQILKFRTMRSATAVRCSDPQRLTRAGHLLRKSSLDELPQLWNVLRGDMSLIGPRPTLPSQVQHYTREQRRRLDVLPGITGWAQVHGRNLLTWPERIELDLWYIAHRSFRLDLWIILLTVAQLVCPRGIAGAGGVNPGFPQQDKSPPLGVPKEDDNSQRKSRTVNRSVENPQQRLPNS